MAEPGPKTQNARLSDAGDSASWEKAKTDCVRHFVNFANWANGKATEDGDRAPAHHTTRAYTLPSLRTMREPICPNADPFSRRSVPFLTAACHGDPDSLHCVADVADWDNLDETVVCGWELWDRLANFLTKEYIISKGLRNSGQALAGSTAVNVLSALMNKASAKFAPGGSSTTKLFFSCLDPNSRGEVTCSLQP